MKKILILFALLGIPAIADAAPSVRMLGNNQNTGAAKITPVKASQAVLTNAANTSRAGALRMKTGSSSGIMTSSSARFPVITSAKVYNNVTTPTAPTIIGGNSGGNSGGNTGGNTVISGDVDVNAIVDAVTNRVRNEYYNRNETYNRQEINSRFDEVNNSITNINQNLDDSRFDAIRTSNPRTARGVDAPAGYVYIWIEE